MPVGLSLASFEVAALRCSTVMSGLSFMYSSMRPSYPNSLNVATVRVIFPPSSPLDPLSLPQPAIANAAAASPAVRVIQGFPTVPTVVSFVW